MAEIEADPTGTDARAPWHEVLPVTAAPASEDPTGTLAAAPMTRPVMFPLETGKQR